MLFVSKNRDSFGLACPKLGHFLHIAKVSDKLSVNPVFTDSLLRDVVAIPFDINIQEKGTYVPKPIHLC